MSPGARQGKESARRNSTGRERGGTRGAKVASSLLAITILLLSGPAWAAAAAAHAQADGESYRAMLVQACERLEREAVKGPYGWGWTGETAEASDEPDENDDADSEQDDPAGRDRGRGKSRKQARNAKAPPPPRAGATREINLRVTAAAGLVLHLAGKELNNPAFAKGAAQAARAIAAVQLPTGQVPPTARLVPKPAGHPDNSEIVPDRTATCAAIALLTSVLDATKDKPDPRVASAATRAATWLARQQTGDGGWQSAYPAGAGPKARRLIRLDGPAYRDATFALILASRTLPRKEYALAADRSVKQLLALRITAEDSPGAGLWAPAYSLGGVPVEDVEEMPYVIDVKASRYAIETLLAARLVTGKEVGKELAAAAKAAAGLPKTDGLWQRWYDLYLREPGKPEPARGGSDVFEREADDDEASAVVDDFGFPGVLKAANSSLAIGPDKFGRQLTADFSRSERLAQAVCGLADDALTFRLPTEPKDREAFLDAPADGWAMSPELPKPIARAWALLLRAKVEQRAAAGAE
jgi:hypothetical protein